MRPIEKSNLCDEVFNRIIQDIITGKLGVGDKIASENELREMLGVSRNTIRSALSRLNALGILEARHGEGYYIRNINVGIYVNSLLPVMLLSSRDLESITEFRIGVESAGAALAAARADENDISEMERHLLITEESYNDNHKFAIGDMEFHLAVARASKNELFISATEMIKTMYTIWLTGFVKNHGKEQSSQYHRQIFESIKRGDSISARKQMYDHLSDVLFKIKSDNSNISKS